jgi:hypothetical protein
VRILPATIHPRCLKSESLARGVGEARRRWQPSAIWPRSGERSAQPALFTKLVSSLTDNDLRAMMEMSGQKAGRGSWLT